MGWQVVDFNVIPNSYSKLSIEVGDFLILMQHAEVTMIHTLYHDDLFRLKEKAKIRLNDSPDNMHQLYNISNYVLINIPSILSTVEVDENHPEIESFFTFQ